MPRIKKPKKDKSQQTTAEFIERLARQGAKRNGLKIRLGFANHDR